jgi:hypothetical protein
MPALSYCHCTQLYHHNKLNNNYNNIVNMSAAEEVEIGEEVELGEEVIYNEPPPSQQIPTGGADEEELDEQLQLNDDNDEESPKKKCTLSRFNIIIITGAVLLALILMFAIGFSPIGNPSAANRNKPNSATKATVDTYAPTYMPTYAPTVAETEPPVLELDLSWMGI